MKKSSNSRNSISKSNSPVKKTGEKSRLAKRLIIKNEEELLKGRERILMAARECFAVNGFAGTSIKDIQDKSGFSRGNLYYHFKTKEEIVQVIIHQNLGQFCDRIDDILYGAKKKEYSLKETIIELSNFADQITKGPGKGMAFHVWSLSMTDPDIRATTKIHFDRIIGSLELAIIQLIEKGRLPKNTKTQQLSVVLFGLVIPAFTLQSVFMDEKALDPNNYVDALELLFSKNT